MKLIGYTSALDPHVTQATLGILNALFANEKLFQMVRTPPFDVYVVKLSVYADGLGPGGADQVMRGLVIDGVGNVVAVGGDVTVPAGAPAQWFDLPFIVPGGQLLGFDQDYGLGIHFGQSSQGARIAVHDPSGIQVLTEVPGSSGADVFEDGTNPSVTSLVPFASHADIAIFATYVTPWVPPQAPVDFYAKLPFADAQSLLFTGPTTTIYAGSCGWHYTAIDQAEGSFCVVDPGGPLAGLVGKRLRITNATLADQRNVIAYCHRAVTLPTGVPISITRRLFTELAHLASTNIPARIEVLG